MPISPSRRRKSTGLPLRRRNEVRRVKRMDTEVGGTAMNNLLGHGEADGISLLMCTDEHDRTELQDERYRCEMRPHVPRSGGRECGSGLPMDSIAEEQSGCVQKRVSPVPFRILPGHCFGAFATPGGTAPFCFPDSSPRAGLGPCSRMHGLALGSRAHSHGFAQV